jgi:uncharacterized protein (DUF433 family)
MSTSSKALRDRIIVDARILVGKPVVRGTRIPVSLILNRLSADLDVAALLESYPSLTREDVRACLAYAGAVIAAEDVFPGLPVEGEEPPP